MIDFIVENYYDGFLLTFAFGIFVYIRNTKNIKIEMNMIRFFITNTILSLIWFIIIPITVVLSFKDLIKMVKK